jgi:coproporphyrinogen III oxidase-like Fe-S oxidoreductase
LMGLRLRDGVDLARIRTLSGIDNIVDDAAIERLAAHQLLTLDQDQLTVTEQGMLLLDSILPEIVLT